MLINNNKLLGEKIDMSITKNTHHGHSIKRYRQSLGIKQEAIASDMGVSQALVSFYEKKKFIENEMLEKFAQVLNISPEILKELEEDPVTAIAAKRAKEESEGDESQAIESQQMDLVKQFLELTNEKAALYKRILSIENEKAALMKNLLNKNVRT